MWITRTRNGIKAKILLFLRVIRKSETLKSIQEFKARVRMNGSKANISVKYTKKILMGGGPKKSMLETVAQNT